MVDLQALQYRICNLGLARKVTTKNKFGHLGQNWDFLDCFGIFQVVILWKCKSNCEKAEKWVVPTFPVSKYMYLMVREYGRAREYKRHADETHNSTTHVIETLCMSKIGHSNDHIDCCVPPLFRSI